MTFDVWMIVFWTVAAVLVYEHLGYLLMVRLLGALFGRRGRADVALEKLPTVSLVIPAHNEADVLEAKLENALALDYPQDRLEIIVADDASSDATARIARAHAYRGVTLVSSAERTGKAGMLNLGVARSSGELICLCDANVMFRPDALRRMVARFADPRVGAVTGDVRLVSEQSDFGRGEKTYYRLERRIQLDESRLGTTICVDGGMYVLRRELHEPLPTDTILDDFVTSVQVIRQGKRVVYEPAAVATENGTPTASLEFRRRARVMAGAVQALKRGHRPSIRQPLALWMFVSHKLLRWAGPLWLALLLVSCAMLWQSGTFYRACLIGQLAVYAVAAAATLSRRFRATCLGGVVFYFAMSHVSMAWGLLKGLFNLQPVAWQPTARARVVENPKANASN